MASRLLRSAAPLISRRTRNLFTRTNQFPTSQTTSSFSRAFHQGRCLFNTEAKDTEAKEESTPETEAKEEATEESEHQKALEEKDANIKEANDKLLRTLADMQNLRDRSKREVENAGKYSAGEMAKVLLEVSDNLALALESVADDANDENPKLKSFHEGVQMTEKSLLKCFGKFGITPHGEVGDKFDPNVHDCLYEYVDEAGRPGTVGQVVKTGFMIKDRVLRAAQVGAIKGKYVPAEGEEA